MCHLQSNRERSFLCVVGGRKQVMQESRAVFKLGSLTLSPRQVELSIAGITSIAMAALIYEVTVISQTPAVNEIAGLDDADTIAVFPDFVSVRDVTVKKSQFFDYLEDYIIAENQAIAALRAELLPYIEVANTGVPFSQQERNFVFEVAEIYRVDVETLTEQEIANELSLRVDEIPVSLALAQAANESAWGTSRFTLEGNNIFGEWCFSPGCGIVPRRRPSGASHEVQRFDSIAESIESYILNINTHRSYRYLRDLRAEMREKGNQLDSMLLATGLGRYSQRGDHYVDEVQNIIMQNNLADRDKS